MVSALNRQPSQWSTSITGISHMLVAQPKQSKDYLHTLVCHAEGRLCARAHPFLFYAHPSTQPDGSASAVHAWKLTVPRTPQQLGTSAAFRITFKFRTDGQNCRFGFRILDAIVRV